MKLGSIDIVDLKLGATQINEVRHGDNMVWQKTVPASIEAETTAYMNAIAISNNATIYYTGTAQERTGAQLWTYVDNYVKGLKTNSLLSKIIADYRIIGGTAVRHSYNLINPSSYQISWFGSMVHNELGAKGNGANAYGKTFVIPSATQQVNSNGMTVVIGTNEAELKADTCHMGTYNSPTQGSLITSKRSGDNIFSVRGNGSLVNDSLNTGSLGIFSFSRTSSTETKSYKNGILKNTGNSGGTLPALPIYIGNISLTTDAPYSDGYSTQRFQGGIVHSGLTGSELTTLSTLINNLETALGRKTW